MKMRYIFFITIPFCLFSSSVFAVDDLKDCNDVANDLKARAEVNLRIGDERSISMTELWIPLAQNTVSENVLYTSLRIMGDNQDNYEGNWGIGYRETIYNSIFGDGIVGVNGWLDRRITERNSKFYQATIGAEWLGEVFDIRLNGYIPLSREKKHSVPNADPQASTLSGTGIFVDTNSILLEEAQAGGDFELGLEIGQYSDFIKENTDSLRCYVGGYYFDGNYAQSVTGWRTRLTADLTQNIQIGARFQNDDVRGYQGFLEATFRFPAGRKKRYRAEGLVARLDEAPERDIDIITGNVTTDTGDNIELINNETGTTLEIIHVDNTAADGGDGSIETPFNTLVAAQVASSEGTIIYVHTGDGSDTGQNQGITLNKQGQQLVGAGTDLIFDTSHFATANGQIPISNILISASTAPVLSNINADGNGVTVSADNVLVTGITVDGAKGYGVLALNDDGTTWESSEIDNVTAKNNSKAGIAIYAQGVGSIIKDATISNSSADNNASLTNDAGLTIIAGDGGRVNNATVTGSEATNNLWDGVRMWAHHDSTLDNVLVDNTVIDGNRTQGVQIYATYYSYVDNVVFRDIQSTNNGSQNVLAYLPRSTVNNLILENIYSDRAGLQGVWIYPTNESTINSATLNSIVSTNSHLDGININAKDTSNINGLILSNTTVTGNAGNGVYVYDNTTGAFLVDLGGGVLGSTGNNSIYGNTTKDLRVDLDGGELKAENNWWGSDTGLSDGNVSLDEDSTYDADPYLNSAP